MPAAILRCITALGRLEAEMERGQIGGALGWGGEGRGWIPTAAVSPGSYPLFWNPCPFQSSDGNRARRGLRKPMDPLQRRKREIFFLVFPRPPHRPPPQCSMQPIGRAASFPMVGIGLGFALVGKRTCIFSKGVPSFPSQFCRKIKGSLSQ